MESPDRFLSDANTNVRIPHRRLVTKAKGRVPAHATLTRYSLPLVAQFVGFSADGGRTWETNWITDFERIG